METFRQFDLHKLIYQHIRQHFNLSAQMTVRCIAKVADAYKLDKETQRTFRPMGAQPYDDRIFRFVSNHQISIWTLNGREKEAKREWYVKRRATLQKKGTQAAKRRLKKM